MAKTKYEFHRENEQRRKNNEPILSWKEFVTKNPLKKVGRPRMPDELKKPQSKRTSFYLNFEPEPKPVINREPARYDNHSFEDIYKKYGV